MSKINYPIIISLIMGVAVLYFFPEPESNFLVYLITLLSFVVFMILLVIWQKKKEK